MEYLETLKHYLTKELTLKSYSSKRKYFIPMLFFFWDKFEGERIYSEKEVNAIIDSASEFGDAAMVRRDLVDFGFMSRTKDGREYRKSEKAPDIKI